MNIRKTVLVVILMCMLVQPVFASAQEAESSGGEGYVTSASAPITEFPASGGDCEVYFEGVNFPETFIVRLGNMEKSRALALSVDGTTAVATIPVPANAMEVGRIDHVMVSFSSGQRWSPVGVSLTVRTVMVDNLTVEPAQLPAEGGEASFQVSGSFAVDPNLTIGLFDGDIAVSSVDVKGATGEGASGTLQVPFNPTEKAVTYALRVSVDGGETWSVGGREAGGRDGYPSPSLTVAGISEASTDDFRTGRVRASIEIRDGKGLLLQSANAWDTIEIVRWDMSSIWMYVLYGSGSNAGWVEGRFITPLSN